MPVRFVIDAAIFHRLLCTRYAKSAARMSPLRQRALFSVSAPFIFFRLLDFA
jgi:hypothetical protein